MCHATLVAEERKRHVPRYTRLSRSNCNMCHATLVCRGAKPHMPGYTRLSRSGSSMCHATLVVSVPLHRLQTNSIVSPRSESSSSKAYRAHHCVAHWSKYGIRCRVDCGAARIEATRSCDTWRPDPVSLITPRIDHCQDFCVRRRVHTVIDFGSGVTGPFMPLRFCEGRQWCARNTVTYHCWSCGRW